jgi:cytochrome P450
MSQVATADVDLVGDDAVRDPHAVFRALREMGPIHWLPRHEAWLLLDYEVVRSALQDDEFTTDNITPLYERLTPEERQRYATAERLFRGWMIFNDPPVHTMLRRPVAAAFSVKGVAELRDSIAQLTDELLASLQPDAEHDFVSAVAFPLPANVVALLLGASPDRFRDMQTWSRQLGALVMGKVSRRDSWARALAAAEEMQRYFGELIAHYRQHPAPNLVTRMLDAGTAGESLTDEQLVGACSLLLFGGHETTMSLLSTGLRLLSAEPDTRRRLVDDPAFLESAIEEIVRFDGPSKILVRRVRRDREWEGHRFRAGERVFCAVMAANRDPNHFEHPDAFVPDRSPNRHVGYGFGLHYCLGAQLARLEASVALPRVLARFPNLTVTQPSELLSYHPTIVGRTLKALPVRLR